jgi:predicted small lipoprotein YifL
MKPLFLRSVLLACLFLSVSACGNKGDLYMPDKDQEQSKVVNSNSDQPHAE